MDGKITIKYLQNYIKSKDYYPDLTDKYFIKLIEEVGELARAMHKGLPANRPEDVKNTIDEELYDILYMVLALANCYGIDMEKTIPQKEKLSNQRYHHTVVFEENR